MVHSRPHHANVLELPGVEKEWKTLASGCIESVAFLLIPLARRMAACCGTLTASLQENVVGTLAVVYSISNFIDTEELMLVSALAMWRRYWG